MSRPYTLVGVNGNAFSIMGYTAKAMRRSGFSEDDIKAMQEKSMSGDYNNLLCVCCEYIDKVNDKLRSDGELEEDDE